MIKKYKLIMKYLGSNPYNHSYHNIIYKMNRLEIMYQKKTIFWIWFKFFDSQILLITNLQYSKLFSLELKPETLPYLINIKRYTT